MSERPLTILFMPESASGPTNNCIGIGDVLRRRGHRVVFATEASWKGRLEPALAQRPSPLCRPRCSAMFCQPGRSPDSAGGETDRLLARPVSGPATRAVSPACRRLRAGSRPRRRASLVAECWAASFSPCRPSLSGKMKVVVSERSAFLQLPGRRWS